MQLVSGKTLYDSQGKCNNKKYSVVRRLITFGSTYDYFNVSVKHDAHLCISERIITVKRRRERQTHFWETDFRKYVFIILLNEVSERTF